MSNKTSIEWTDITWNPVSGCSKVSQGCKHCYAERLWPKVSAAEAKRTGKPKRAFTNVRCHPERLDQPLRMRNPQRIFVNSMSDLFHEDVPDEFIDQVFAVMGTAKWHTFQVLTKRPRRMLEWFSEKWQAPPESSQRERHEIIAGVLAKHGRSAPEFKYDAVGEDRFDQVYEALGDLEFCTNPEKDHLYTADGTSNLMAAGWPLPNVWLGVSVEDQAMAYERIPLLLHTPAAVRFISAEPLLGGIEIRPYLHTGWSKIKGRLGVLDWVIAGGESGPQARPMHPYWLRSLRDQCADDGVPFFFKQWGEFIGGTVHDAFLPPREPDHCWGNDGDYASFRVGKKAAGRTLDGRTHDDFPGLWP